MMKLSEAIRLGEFALPPVRGAWFDASLVSGRICGGCAVGRAIYAAGYRPERMPLKERVRRYTDTGGRVAYTGYEIVPINAFVAKHWPWTVKYTDTTDSGRVARLLGWQHEYNAVVERISQNYEYNRKTTIQAIADDIEQLEAKWDTQPATTVVAPNTAGDAVQLMEVQ